MDVAKQPGLMRRGTRWWLRVRVPDDVLDAIGRREIWRSLRTSDYGQAQRLCRAARVEIDEWFERVRRARRGLPEGDEARRVVADWLRDSDRANVDHDLALRGDELYEAVEQAELDLDHLRGGDDASVQAVVDRVLIGAGFPAREHRVGRIGTSRSVADVDPSLPELEGLRGLAHRAMVEEQRRRLDRLHGRPAANVDPAFEWHPGAEDRGITLGELVERFTADRAPRLGRSKLLEYRLLFRVLSELWGDDTPVREVTREDCRRVRDLLASLPPNATKRWPRLTLRQAAERARERGVAPVSATTANAYLGRLSGLLRWAEREHYVDRNVAVGLTVAAPEPDRREARLPFSPDQLARIFGPEFAKLHGARRWVPLVALYGGLRLNEACQLGVDDVEVRDGTDVMLVRPDAEAGARVKTGAGRRVVPVHPELVRLGFLEFAARQRDAGHRRLFPELRRDRRGYYSDGTQKWFSRYLRKVGAKEERTSFHSLRHCFRDALREIDAPRDVVLALGGWSAQAVDDQYGGGLRPSTLARWVSRISYDGLDLSHLHRE